MMRCPKCGGEHVEKVTVKKIVFDAHSMKTFEDALEVYGYCCHCDHEGDYKDFSVADWCAVCGFKFLCKCESYRVEVMIDG